MSAKHVPAPWHVEAHGGGDYTVLEHDKTEVIASDGDLSDETMATARLIAAAPDLLAALEFVMCTSELGCVTEAVVRSAIAKAIG